MGDNTKLSIAVLIPCFNEERTISKVIRDFRSALPVADIYVYDNNSTDRTAALAAASGALVRTETRQGKGNVVRTMFRDIDADCYILVDGDATYPAAAAPDMAKAVLEEGCDMVVGDRLSSTYFQENKRRFHNFGNILVRALINRLIAPRGTRIYDVMTGYRAFSYTFAKSFPITSRGFEIETEMTAHALDKNLKVKNLPIDYQDRPSGSYSKLSTLSDGVKVLATLFNLMREYRPLLFFSLCALFFFLAFTATFTGIFLEYLQTGLVPRQPTLLVSLFCLLISILCVFSGLILDALARKSRRDFELAQIALYHHYVSPGTVTAHVAEGISATFSMHSIVSPPPR